MKFFFFFIFSNNNQHQNISTFFTFYIISIFFITIQIKKFTTIQNFFIFLYKLFLLYITSSLFINFEINNPLLYSVHVFAKQNQDAITCRYFKLSSFSFLFFSRFFILLCFWCRIFLLCFLNSCYNAIRFFFSFKKIIYFPITLGSISLGPRNIFFGLSF
jgi:hypothetical protein